MPQVRRIEGASEDADALSHVVKYIARNEGPANSILNPGNVGSIY